MNITQLENQKTILQQKLEETFSSRRKLIYISDFFNLLLCTSNTKIIEPFIAELIEEYIFCLEQFDITGLHPKATKNIIAQIKRLISLDFLQDYSERLNQIILYLSKKVNELEDILNGKPNELSTKKKAYFPIIEEGDDEYNLGLLESISISIKASKTETNFIIVPSGKEIEDRIKQQINDSWEAAKIYCKDYIKKINPHHEVIISFDKRIGDYVGNSLGIALTISFIEELLLFYNAPTVVEINEGIAFTGSNDVKGNICGISKEIIEKKVEIIFYSDISTFVIPG